ncbi:MAG: sigma-70 family RNA polymerase sigma factor [Bacteroidota bacterium]
MNVQKVLRTKLQNGFKKIKILILNLNFNFQRIIKKRSLSKSTAVKNDSEKLSTDLMLAFYALHSNCFSSISLQNTVSDDAIDHSKKLKIKMKHSESDDAEIIARITSGDSEAIAFLYDRYSTPLYSIAYKIVRHPEETEEIIQDVYLTIWNKSATIDFTKSKLFTWMVRVTRNKCIDRLRQKQRLQKFKASDDVNAQIEELIDSRNTAIHHTYQKEKAEEVVQAVKQLNEKERHTIELAFFKGLSHRQISEREQESLGTIKSRIRYALQKLRNKMGKETHAAP